MQRDGHDMLGLNWQGTPNDWSDRSSWVQTLHGLSTSSKDFVHSLCTGFQERARFGRARTARKTGGVLSGPRRTALGSRMKARARGLPTNRPSGEGQGDA